MICVGWCGARSINSRDRPTNGIGLNSPKPRVIWSFWTTKQRARKGAAGVDECVPADRKRPLSTGDYLCTDQGAQAELHLDVAALRMSPQTSFGFLNLDNQTVQIKLSEGEMYFRVRNFGSNQVFEVDTPNAALTFLQNGIYVVSVDPNANTSYLTVREGQAQVTGGGQAFTVDQG